jgi:hypothetical protein
MVSVEKQITISFFITSNFRLPVEARRYHMKEFCFLLKRKFNKYIHEPNCIELNQLVKRIQLLRSEDKRMRMEKARYLLAQFLPFGMIF